MKISEEDSLLALFSSYEERNPELYAMILAKTEPEFVEAAERALESAIKTVEQRAKHYGKLDEPGLSGLLVDLMARSGFTATAEEDTNGHVDITIKHFSPRKFRYLGECKIWHGYQYHVDGCSQLLGYCTGREPRGFLLGFFKQEGMYTRLEELKNDFVRERPTMMTEADCAPHSIKGAFLSSHTHPSGTVIEVLHLGCNLCP